MKNKIFVSVLSVIVLLLLLFPPVNKLLCNAGILSHTDLGNHIQPERKEGSAWYARVSNTMEEAKAALTDLYCNYLPFYNDLVAEYGEIERIVSEPFYLLAERNTASPKTNGIPAEPAEIQEPQESVTVESEPVEEENVDQIVSLKTRFLSEDATHRYYLLTAGFASGITRRCIDRFASQDIAILKKNYDQKLEDMLRVVKYLSQKTNVYVYSGSRFQDSPDMADCLPDEYSTEKDRDDFLEALSPYADTGYLKLDTLEDRFEKIYLTDHHWNAAGIKEGYEDLHAMLQKNWPEISSVHDADLMDVKDIRFYGSFSRAANYYGTYDDFPFYDYHLDEHKAYGGSVINSQLKYITGRYDNNRGVYHYEVFYPPCSRIDYPENDTGHNLLLIGDSFTWGISETIASHFDSTIVRYIWDSDSYDLEQILADNNITDVIFVIFSDRMMYNLYGDMRSNCLLTPAD